MANAQDERTERLNSALRSWYGAFSDLGRRFGLDAGMHHSDASALIQITDAEQRGAPLTQGQLGRRIGLSVPATSALVARLESAGYVAREPHPDDRRAIALRSTAAVHRRIQTYFQSVGDDLDAIAADYSAEQLDATTEMLTRMTAVMDEHLRRMLRRQD